MCVHGRRRYLPDLPILSIFDSLPLYKLLQTGRVCPRFAQLQTVALANRKMLTIFVGENVDRKKLYESEVFFEPHLDTHTTREAEEAMAEFSALELKTLNQEMVNWLKSTFPRVTKLRLIIGHGIKLSDVTVNVTQLLEHWADKLESVGIWAEYTFGIEDDEEFLSDIDQSPNLLASLFAVISEKLHSLQSLTIAVHDFVEVFSNWDLSFLGRLKLFSTDSYSFDYPQQMFASLNHHGALLENIPEIRLFGKNDNLAEVKPLLPRLASKITALHSGDIVSRTEEGSQQDLSIQLPALKWYKQRVFDVGTSLDSFFISLSKFSHLKYLELDKVPFCSPERFQFQQELPPLPSLETLAISGYIPDQHFLQLLGSPLDRLFPALKTIQLEVVKKYDLTEPAPVRKRLPNGERRMTAYRSASKPRMEELFGGLLRQLAQLALKGSLRVRLVYQVSEEGDSDEEYRYLYIYGEEFNFTDGSTMENWQIKEETIREDEEFDDY